jgi:hypothetical protein
VTHSQNALVALVAGLLSVVGMTLAVMAGAAPAPAPASPPRATPAPSVAVHR